MGIFGKSIPEQMAEKQQQMNTTTRELASNAAMANGQIGNGLAGASTIGISAGSISNNQITNAQVQGYPWEQHQVVPPTTNIVTEGEDAGDLRAEVKRVTREVEFLNWLYGLKIGEYGQFLPEYNVYTRTLTGWIITHRDGMTDEIPFVRREDIQR